MPPSSASVRTVERDSVNPVLRSSTVCRLRHFATVLGDPELPAQRCERSLRSLYCCSDGMRGCGASVTNLSHRASFHSFERITPSNRGIKHLARPEEIAAIGPHLVRDRREAPALVPGFADLAVEGQRSTFLILASPRPVSHSPKVRLVVTMTEVRSYRRLVRWKRNWPPVWAKGK